MVCYCLPQIWLWIVWVLWQYWSTFTNQLFNVALSTFINNPVVCGSLWIWSQFIVYFEQQCSQLLLYLCIIPALHLAITEPVYPTNHKLVFLVLWHQPSLTMPSSEHVENWLPFNSTVTQPRKLISMTQVLTKHNYVINWCVHLPYSEIILQMATSHCILHWDLKKNFNSGASLSPHLTYLRKINFCL